MAKCDPIALDADPDDPEDFDVSEAGLAGALADRAARRAKVDPLYGLVIAGAARRQGAGVRMKQIAA